MEFLSALSRTREISCAALIASRPMPADTLTRLLAKHRRARVHLEELNRAVRHYVDSEPYRIESALSADQLEYVFTAHDIKPVPEEISLIAGDVVHNCRACLDHLAWEISLSPDRTTSFGILRNHPPSGAPTIAGGLSHAHQAALVSVQPYQTHRARPEFAPLEVLRTLDNTDKHQVILTGVSAVNTNVHGEPCNYRGSAPEADYHFCVLEEGAKVATFRCSEPSPEMSVPDFDIHPTVDLVDVRPTGFRFDARQVLWDIHKAVQATVNAFEPF